MPANWFQFFPKIPSPCLPQVLWCCSGSVKQELIINYRQNHRLICLFPSIVHLKSFFIVQPFPYCHPPSEWSPLPHPTSPLLTQLRCYWSTNYCIVYRQAAVVLSITVLVLPTHSRNLSHWVTLLVHSSLLKSHAIFLSPLWESPVHPSSIPTAGPKNLSCPP